MQTDIKYDMCECGRAPATEKYIVGGTAEGNVFEYWCSSCISEDPTDSAAAGSSALRAPEGGADSDSVITVESNSDIPSGYYEGTGWLHVQKMYKNGDVSKQFNKFYTKPEFDSVKYTGKNQVVYIQCDRGIGYFVVSKFGDMGDACRRDIYSVKEQENDRYRILRIANGSHFNFKTHRGRAYECRLVCSR